ncbi:hypothetical protein [Brachybacterium sacelli]|uniref:Uncharacterized protein n=1 Tax=Brachybacterium sacelli TaxID=173364 RepID=A0ABS4X5E2_9MICO|nr:hypothetical protein [Brachybacterium sacelli]MBP2383685.1 hypothetical protein [Brachybacterium sacelli]
MNLDHDEQQHEPRERQPEPDRTAAEPVEKTETPEAVQAARVARHGDDTVNARQRVGRRARGVEWVRPTDLLARHGAALAGRGVDFEVELARRTRTGMTSRLRGLGDRTRRLPPLSAFGRSQTAPAGPSRPGVGMS